MYEGDWWNAPVLQGPENDYGQYDYMIEELPQDKAEWRFERDTGHCECCGKQRHYLFYYTHYFRTMDGWDSMEHSECWKCMVGDKIYSIKRKIVLRIKTFKLAMELYKRRQKFSDCYKLAKKIVR